jgi:hypothetical protein
MNHRRIAPSFNLKSSSHDGGFQPSSVAQAKVLPLSFRKSGAARFRRKTNGLVWHYPMYDLAVAEEYGTAF